MKNYSIIVIYYKVLKKIGKNNCFWFLPQKWWWNPSFWARSFTNMKFDPRVICSFKNQIFELLDTPIAINTSSKQWIFHVWKCPKFVDPVFHQIWLRPKDLATLAWNLKIFCEMLSFRKKSLCSHTPWAHAENEWEKSLRGPGGSKKSRIQFFLASFWKSFGPPFRPPNHNFFTHS